MPDSVSYIFLQSVLSKTLRSRFYYFLSFAYEKIEGPSNLPKVTPLVSAALKCKQNSLAAEPRPTKGRVLVNWSIEGVGRGKSVGKAPKVLSITYGWARDPFGQSEYLIYEIS